MISLGIIIIPLVVYFFKFSGATISNKPSDWGEFATYFTAFVSLANLVMFIYFTRLVYEYSLTRDELLNDLERPVISFSKLTHHDRYDIENVGKGTAINIDVKSHLDERKSSWGQKRVTYSFQSGQSKTMNWTTGCNALCATYQDIFGKEYVSYFEDDKLIFIDLSNEKSKSQYSMQLTLSKLNAQEETWFS